MFLVGFVSWWYGRGWMSQWGRLRDRLIGTLEFFSIGQLLGTLFAPFRQISAGGNASTATFGDEIRAFFDKLISRCIGLIIRLATIIFGLIVILLQTVYELIIVVAWWFVPLFPIIGGILFAIGWVPSWT